ncbi:uncharacterized protein [Macrobrachium rosenbergii]|uniref:uncharacterized protein n=1 Tax=Macrobrachium rosenbergii TaxID=79674 RepID=UPI0034D78674
MWTTKIPLVLVVFYFGWCLQEGAAFLQLLQLGTGTAATYVASITNPGAALAAGLGGAFALGTLSGALGSTRGSWRWPRYGRSVGAESPAGAEVHKDFAIDLVESLDRSGCAKKLLCEQAFLEAQEEQEGKNTFVGALGQEEQQGGGAPGGGGISDSENAGEKGTLSADEVGEMMLLFVREVPSTDVSAGGSREMLLKAAALGEGGGNCSEAFQGCPYTRTEMLSLIMKGEIL